MSLWYKILYKLSVVGHSESYKITGTGQFDWFIGMFTNSIVGCTLNKVLLSIM